MNEFLECFKGFYFIRFVFEFFIDEEMILLGI